MSVHLISHTFTISKTSSSKSMYTVSRKRIFDANEVFFEYFFSKLRDKIPVVLRGAGRKYRLGLCKMKKLKILKLCQNIVLGKLFLVK